MGATLSQHTDTHVFKKELELVNRIVNNIINEKDIYRNNNYNFLSKDVCKNYQVILEEELKKHLKISLNAVGTTLYIIPKNDEHKLTKLNLSKDEVCKKISNHYIKILYILSLIKYVYNIEQDGDLSIGGIILRNIRFLDDLMEINFCDLPHRDYKVVGKQAYKIDFSKLEGFKFFVDKFLDNKESIAFLGVLKSILARSKKNKVSSIICHYIANNSFNQNDVHELEKMYMSKFNEKFVCDKQNIENGNILSAKHNIAINIFINSNNPIFAKEYCFAPRKIIVKLSSKNGIKLKKLYKQMLTNYKENIDKIVENLSKLVSYSDGTYVLKDIDKHTLDTIIENVKICIKTFYIQSIIDYQKLLDEAKLMPNIEFEK